MYKVFINEKKLTLSQSPINGIEKTLAFEDFTTLEMAVDLLENTSCPEVNVFHEDVEMAWDTFRKTFKIVEAAGGIVKNNEGNLLFIHRLGRWDLPKGKIEIGESLQEAALREVEEETSLKELQLIDFLNNTYHIYRERNGNLVLKITHWFRMNYLGNEQPTPQVEEGIIKAEWLNFNDIEKEVIPTTFKNIQLILEEYLR